MWRGLNLADRDFERLRTYGYEVAACSCRFENKGHACGCLAHYFGSIEPEDAHDHACSNILNHNPGILDVNIDRVADGTA